VCDRDHPLDVAPATFPDAARRGSRVMENWKQDLLDLVDMSSQWMVLATIVAIIVWAAYKRVPMYESFVTGAKEGFGIAVMIVPFLAAMLLVVKVFLASGILDDFQALVGSGMQWAGAGAHSETLELLPLAFTRPLTGSGSRALLIDLFQSHGPDSFIGNTASIMMGSSETTFYVLTIYFGAVNIKKIRHTLAACLLADLVGVVIAVTVGYLLFYQG
jgi:spore maturation protein B